MYAFIDESGDHNLDLTKVDNTYNIFVLAAVLISKTDYSALDAEFKQLKREIFGSEDFIIHTSELTRPLDTKSDPRNAILREKSVRFDFYTRLNSFLAEASFSCIYMVIRKNEHLQKYPRPQDPYELSFENILNRILHYSESNAIDIHPECRNDDLDRKLEAEFLKYSVRGTQFHLPDQIKKRIRTFSCKQKGENLTGLQIADLMAAPVGRHFVGIKPKPLGNEVPYSLARSKIRGPQALTVFP